MTTGIDQTDVHAYVGEAARSRMDTIRDLLRIATGDEAIIDEYSNDETLLDLAYGQPGPISAEQLAEEAAERLDTLPLCVESTRTFEIVLGTGGPDDRILIECGEDPQGSPGRDMDYEPRRVSYRYSWEGSGEVKLTGEDREAALELARRVVPELADV
jgi:hypothetical protein